MLQRGGGDCEECAACGYCKSFVVCFAALCVNSCDLKGLEGIFGMMAGGRPRMLTEDDIKKRKEFLQRCFEYREFDLLCWMHVRFAITLSLRTHVRRAPFTLVAVQETKTNVASAPMREGVCWSRRSSSKTTT